MAKGDLIKCKECGTVFALTANTGGRRLYCDVCRAKKEVEKKAKQAGISPDQYNIEVKCTECGNVFKWWTYRRRLCDECLAISKVEARKEYRHRHEETNGWHQTHKSAFDSALLKKRTDGQIREDAKKRAKKSQKHLTQCAKDARRLGLSYGQLMALRAEQEAF